MIKDCKISDSKRKWFADKVLAHEPLLRGYLQCLVPRSPDIDDLLQETYARLLATADGEIERVRATGEFVCRTAHSLVLERIRSQRVVSLDLMAQMESLQVMHSIPWLDRIPDTRQELTLLRRIVTGLPRRYRKIFVLSKVHGFPHEEIAALLGIPQRKVEQQIAAGIRLCATRMFASAGGQRRGLLAQMLSHGAMR